MATLPNWQSATCLYMCHPMNEPRLNIPEWTVTELSAALKKTVEDTYGYVRVRGEITGYRGPHSSGHCYFGLKDEGAKIDAVIWKGVYGRIRFKPEEGLEVIATGRLTTYPGRSSYQIVIETLEPAGVGALMALLEERKKKLAAEGLFDEARKQLLPFLPSVIGVITSPTGAVIRDILHRLSDRFPRHVLVWPVRVQGESAAAEVAAAIRGFNAFPDGGRIAAPGPHHRGARRRLARGSVVLQRGDRGAGGGRQHDPADLGGRPRDRFHADRFRVGPAGADADRGRRDGGAGALRTADADQLARAAQDRRAGHAGLRAAAPSCAPPPARCRSADQLLAMPRQTLDALAERLPRALKANAEIHHKQFLKCATKLGPQLLRNRVRTETERVGNLIGRARRCTRCRARSGATSSRRSAGGSTRRCAPTFRDTASASCAIRERIAALFERGERGVTRLIERRFAALDSADKLLAAFSYQGVLARGFALVRDVAGHPVRTAFQVNENEKLDIQFADGHVKAVAVAAHGGSGPRERQPIRPRPRRRTTTVDPGQGNLFN